jgi:hypothetical protein
VQAHEEKGEDSLATGELGLLDGGSYEAPELTVLGSVSELTLGDKKYGDSDGFTFMGVPIANASA